MRTTLSTAGVAALAAFGAIYCGAAAPPKDVESAACRTPPTIDGVIGSDEWKSASIFPFDMTVISADPPATETRACTLRVMNSANALYVAFQVPDATADDSLSPLRIDAATLAFGKGDELSAGDDRRLIAPGLYRDKHAVALGKDDQDDERQDGRGAMTRKDGVCSFEWAVTLKGDDKGHDFDAKPGDSVRFNVAYFDALQIPLTKARFGGLYGPQLDKPGAWGRLKLAAEVADDGGAAFRGPDWVGSIWDRLRRRGGPSARLKLVESEAVSGTNPPAAKVLVAFTYLDEHGREQGAKAKLFLPASAGVEPPAPIPLHFNAGYELPDSAAVAYLNRGWAVSSPRDLPTNPIIRTANPDTALMHMVRALPFVDDARVTVGGGSAGGYMTLMVAAETFPLAGAMPDVPPVNFAYNAAFLLRPRDPAAAESGPMTPTYTAVRDALKGCLDVYGRDFDDPTYHAHSPIAHLSTITCPVSVSFTTADMLVPIDQVGGAWVRPFAKADFPKDFATDPEALVRSAEGRKTLLDALPAADYEVFPMPVPPGTGRMGEPGAKGAVVDLPVSAEKLWSIAVFDEGPPLPANGHFLHAIQPTHDAFLKRIVTGRIASRQLTLAKLERLMDRYAGREWAPSRLKHLDVAEGERPDVLRGLRTYVADGPENTRTFAELYERLDPARRVLEADVVKSLEGATAR